MTGLQLMLGAPKPVLPRYVCSMCTTERKETNHWFLALIFTDVLHVSNWKPELADRNDVHKLCGDECLGKFVAKYAAAARQLSYEEEKRQG